jgi:hypothetical protein
MKKIKEQTEKSNKIVVDKYDGIKTIDANNLYSRCHTFKLLVARMLKDLSPFKNDPNVITIEHCHIFHTYDSNGTELKTCNSVGGHYHDIDLKVIDGEWKATCSTPRSNKTSKELLPDDRHTHELVYLKSEELQIRKMNADAIRMINEQINKEA